MVRSSVSESMRSKSIPPSDDREPAAVRPVQRDRSFVDDVAFRYVRREIIALIVLSVMAIAGFALTRAAAGAVRALRLQDAAAWYETGERQLTSGQPHEAAVALRRAAAIDHDNRRYQLQWATALAADRQDAAAIQVLSRMREAAPEDPEVNVQLARLAVRNDDLEDAVRHYENAVYGKWSGAEGAARRALRIELIRYLLEHQQRARAVSELLILSGNLPNDANAQNQAGRLFLEAGEPQRALEHFQHALRSDATSQEAQAGAGAAAFAARDYRTAQRYLRAASSASEDVTRMRATTDLVLARDPMRPGLPFGQRRARATLNLAHARQALDECTASSKAAGKVEPSDRERLLAEAAVLGPHLGGVAARPDLTETIEQTQRLVYEIEEQVIARCGGSLLDQALLLIGRLYQDDQP